MSKKNSVIDNNASNTSSNSSINPSNKKGVSSSSKTDMSKTSSNGSSAASKGSTGTLLFLDYDATTPDLSRADSAEVSIHHELRVTSPDLKSSTDIVHKEKFEALERRLHNIETLLWDNRDKYTSSLDIVANREIEISRALDETKKLLKENRELYTQAFNRLFAKEELLESMLRETKEILTENRRIYADSMLELQKKNNEGFEKIKETGILLGPKSALNPYLNRAGGLSIAHD